MIEIIIGILAAAALAVAVGIIFMPREYRASGKILLDGQKGLSRWHAGEEAICFQPMPARGEEAPAWWKEIGGSPVMFFYQEASGKKRFIMAWKTSMAIPGSLIIYRSHPADLMYDAGRFEHQGLHQFHKGTLKGKLSGLLFRKKTGSLTDDPPYSTLLEGFEAYGDTPELARSIIYKSDALAGLARVNAASGWCHLRYYDGWMYLVANSQAISSGRGAGIFTGAARLIEQACNRPLESVWPRKPITLDELQALAGNMPPGSSKQKKMLLPGFSFKMIMWGYFFVCAAHALCGLTRYKAGEAFGPGYLALNISFIGLWFIALKQLRRHRRIVLQGKRAWAYLKEKGWDSDSDGTAYFGMFAYPGPEGSFSLKKYFGPMTWRELPDGAVIPLVIHPDKPEKAYYAWDLALFPQDIEDIIPWEP